MRIEARISEVILLRGMNMASKESGRRSTTRMQGSNTLHTLESWRWHIIDIFDRWFLMRLEPHQPAERQGYKSAFPTHTSSLGFVQARLVLILILSYHHHKETF